MDYKVVWYKKVNLYCFGYSVKNKMGLSMIIFQTKTKFDTREIEGLSLEFDTWFTKAEYVGKDI